MTINHFLCVWTWGGGGGLWEQGTCWLLERTLCTTNLWSGYLFLRALMVRNGEQIIGVARSFLWFQEWRRLKALAFQNSLKTSQKSLISIFAASTMQHKSTKSVMKPRQSTESEISSCLHRGNFTHFTFCTLTLTHLEYQLSFCGTVRACFRGRCALTLTLHIIVWASMHGGVKVKPFDTSAGVALMYVTAAACFPFPHSCKAPTFPLAAQNDLTGMQKCTHTNAHYRTTPFTIRVKITHSK